MSDAQFSVGDVVRIANRHPDVHHRVPKYAKGQTGTVVRVCGLHGQPERFIRGDGQPPSRIYRVRLDQHQLWNDYQGGANDCLDIEIFEYWLERVA